MILDRDSTGASDRDLSAWLAEIERTRDLTRPFAARGGPETRAAHLARAFVAGLRAEMREFRVVVDAAIAEITTNARQLRGVVASTSEQTVMVRRAAAAVAEADRAARRVAATADALRATAADAARATAGSDEGVDLVLTGLAELAGTMGSARAFAAAMERGTAGVARFIVHLRAIAREARVLGINAAIEAAHLDERGTGFRNVADEVNALAVSTTESAHAVGVVRSHLHEARERVAGAVGSSAALIEGLARDVAAARGRSAESREQVDDLDAAIRTVSEAAGRQSTQLSAIAADIELGTSNANAIQAAADRASSLDLRSQLDLLDRSIARYALGDDADAPAEVVACDDPRLGEAVVHAASALRARVDADQREILERINQLSVAIARNANEWKEIAEALDELRVNLSSATHAIEDTAESARHAATASAHMRALLEAARNGFGAAVAELERSLDAVTRVRETVLTAETSVTGATEAAERAQAILDLIDTISGDSTLLSFNAAIEAARAGRAGAGFGIIADEIRALARTASEATAEIGDILGDVANASIAMRATTATAVAQTEGVGARTTAIRGALVDLRTRLEHTLRDAGETAAIVDGQLAAITEVGAGATAALARIDTDFAPVTDGGWLRLADLGTRAHALAARRPLGTVSEAIRELGLAAAERMDAVFDDALARGAITLEDIEEPRYEELTGSRIAELGRLFATAKVPPTGFVPPKYATRFDRAVEDGIMAIIDETVPRHPALTALVPVDLNGYCFAHYRECRRDWTGDYRTDLAQNRIKRFFEDELSLRCARAGLGPGSVGLPPRTPRRVFAERGCVLERQGARPWGVFTFLRDTGVVFNDLSIAIFARGRRVATVRILYDADVV